jgi:hypothetical protein
LQAIASVDLHQALLHQACANTACAKALGEEEVGEVHEVSSQKP